MSDDPQTAQEFIEKAFTDAEATLEKEYDADSLFIWGGQFSEYDEDEEKNLLEQFLTTWQGDNSPSFTWAMVEEVDCFYVEPASVIKLAGRPDQLERVRLFGPDGDLSIRRDAKQFYWHFISESHAQVPVEAAFHPESFWQETANQKCTFARHERRYYQWRRDEREQRVTHKWASDDALQDKQYLRQVQYLENGRVAFVRYVDFEETC